MPPSGGGAEPLGQEPHPAPQAVAIHREPVEGAERPRIGPVDDGSVAQRGPQPEERLLDGVIRLLRRKAEVTGQAPELTPPLRLNADDARAQRIGLG